ncbi:MAG: zinc-binding alcohol dehydrogenase family protein [Acidimicrobiales bacterium]|nr:zinc-binding alcohol dehydrogenase family protein [Acidimicrobiales bacterium]
MLAQVLHTPAPAADGPLRAEERPVPVPGPGQVRVAVAACGVCRTDLQLCEGDLPARRLPIVPGHQVVGHIDAVGAGVTLSIGDAVGIAWIAGACGVCRFCTTQRENLCVAARFTGWDVDGGYAEAVVADAAFVHRLPDGADPVAVAPLLCGGAIGYRALRVAGVGPDRPGRVGLLGFGASATCAIQVARHWGWEVHVLTRAVAEQDRARALGAAWAGAYDDDPPDLLDAAVTFAPVGSVVVRALELLDRGGTVAVNAIHLDRIPAFSYDALWWERSLRSVANVTRSDVRELLELAVALPISTTVEEHPLVDAGTALRRLAAGEVSGAAVLSVDPTPR